MTAENGSGEDLIQRVLGGANPQLERLAAEGVLPLPQEQVVGLQVRLAMRGESDGEVVTIARESLAELNLSYLVEHVRQDAEPDTLSFFLRPETNPALVEAAIQRRGVSAAALTSAAPTLDERAQEVLLLRQDLITENPEILESLATNERLSSYSRRLISEYNRHLLAPEPEAPPEELSIEELPEGELTEEEKEEVAEAIAEVLTAVEPEGDYDEKTGLSEGQVRMLPLPVRIKLIRGAGRTLRGILIKDSNPLIAVGVIKGSAFSEGEAEMVASNRNVCPEVLIEIASRRDFVGKYKIAKALVKNPRAPVATAVKLLPRLSVRDLSTLRNDRNVSEAVRQMAVRFHIARSR